MPRKAWARERGILRHVPVQRETPLERGLQRPLQPCAPAVNLVADAGNASSLSTSGIIGDGRLCVPRKYVSSCPSPYVEKCSHLSSRKSFVSFNVRDTYCSLRFGRLWSGDTNVPADTAAPAASSPRRHATAIKWSGSCTNPRHNSSPGAATSSVGPVVSARGRRADPTTADAVRAAIRRPTLLADDANINTHAKRSAINSGDPAQMREVA
eukprot:CAMPEP_0182928656 /NCGR_PEP_ID=MMETSP0105_2-20130417/15699_1 /TAXON_ID=81532 ORGANISM="Acanthoeca-like sp., Strain 10tr" /NCGR_SAMPLE_ID=MMETSP0105_2 /ASSEMBLY_ACC=CAM_ASM_000205 /LENGTH=210 /DNA_ID=CAMNT_0025066663 /DNA_START=567 /DNA_END=1200 /DNA_ORIENTATION=-